MAQIWWASIEKKLEGGGGGGGGEEKKKEKETVRTRVAGEARTRAPSVVTEDSLSDHLALNVRLLLRELIIAMAITKMPYCRAIWQGNMASYCPPIDQSDCNKTSSHIITNQIAIRPLVI